MKPKHQSWESFAEERIRSAYEEGEFKDLSGYGKPIPGIDEPLDELWWVRKKLEAEELTIATPSTEIRTDIALTLDRLATLKSADETRRQLLLLN